MCVPVSPPWLKGKASCSSPLPATGILTIAADLKCKCAFENLRHNTKDDICSTTGVQFSATFSVLTSLSSHQSTPSHPPFHPCITFKFMIGIMSVSFSSCRLFFPTSYLKKNCNWPHSFLWTFKELFSFGYFSVSFSLSFQLLIHLFFHPGSGIMPDLGMCKTVLALSNFTSNRGNGQGKGQGTFQPSAAAMV